MWIGIAFVLVAGMMWGLVFVAPLLMPEYPALLNLLFVLNLNFKF